jgi:hypothetical protein
MADTRTHTTPSWLVTIVIALSAALITVLLGSIFLAAL